MAILNVHHRTSYRYSQPVEFGEHRLMSRPRDSHDLRLIDTTLLIDPPPSALRWIHDVFGNSIAIATFDRSADTLTFESAFRAQHYPVVSEEIVVEPYASRFPFSYSADDALDLGRTKERVYPDLEHSIDQWVKRRAGPHARRKNVRNTGGDDLGDQGAVSSMLCASRKACSLRSKRSRFVVAAVGISRFS